MSVRLLGLVAMVTMAVVMWAGSFGEGSDMDYPKHAAVLCDAQAVELDFPSNMTGLPGEGLDRASEARWNTKQR